ncbi:hypothetical protein Tco_0503004 [Tanacetum coccineum]
MVNENGDSVAPRVCEECSQNSSKFNADSCRTQRMDDLEKHDRSLLLMREMEVKAREKSKFILSLSGYEAD